MLVVFAGCHASADPQVIESRTARLYGPDSAERVAPLVGPPPAAGAPGAGGGPSAQDVLEDANLERYLWFGLRENAALRAAYDEWRAACERIPQASSMPDPQFSFLQFVEDVQTRTGPQKRRYSLSQTFPWFGKLDLRGAVASGAAEELWQRVAAERLRVERDIRVAYFEYGYLAQSIRITRGVLELLQQLEPVVQRRIAAGVSGQEDLLRLQVEIGRVENELASLDKVRPSLSSRLAGVMNWRDRELLPLPELAEPELQGVTVDALVERANEQNPELRELAERIERNRDALDLAAREKWPDFSVGVDYIETGDALDPSTPGSGDDPWGVRLMFSLPISRSRYAAAEREAERNISAARFALTDRRATLRSDLEHAAFKMDDAERQVVLYRETLLPRAREALDVTRASYRAGSASLLDLIDSERALLEFETGYWRACRDHYQAEARLQALVGGQLR